MAKKVRILNIYGAMNYGVDEKAAGKVVEVENKVADALVGMHFAEAVEDPPMKAEPPAEPKSKLGRPKKVSK